MTTIADFIKHIAPNMSTLCWVFVLGSVFIQITPIKFSPISSLLEWIGHIITRSVESRLIDIQNQIVDLENKEVKRSRWEIIKFAQKVQQGEDKYTREAWEHCIEQLIEYEQYTKEHNIRNGKIKHTGVYLEDIYHKHLENNDFYIGGTT